MAATTKTGYLIITVLFIVWILLETYWKHFLGVDWGWYFKETYDNGEVIGYSAEWFMSDLVEEIQGLICFVALSICMPTFVIFNIGRIKVNVWYLFFIYGLWTCYDYMEWQSQTNYGIREIAGVFLTICLVAVYVNHKEDESN